MCVYVCVRVCLIMMYKLIFLLLLPLQNLVLYSANILRAINFADFAVSLQSAKIISAKMNGHL